VGGAVRDRLLGRATADLDLVVAGDPGEAAGRVAQAAGGAACFELSHDYGAWRVVARDHAWQLDVEPMRGGDLDADLALRDFTINAIAEPLAGGAPVDPLGGLADLRAGRLRMATPGSFAADPLRVLRLVRIAVELGLQPDAETARAAAQQARALASVSAERVFMELCRTLAAPAARRGVEMLAELGALAVVLPELDAMRGVEQNRFHHLDVYGHTLEVLDRTIELTSGAESPFPLPVDLATPLRALLAEPLADGLTRAQALRWGALLHDSAKPLTRELRGARGGVTFFGHDVRGAELARAVLARLRASERLRAHVAALVREHLRLGFLVHEPQPLSRRALYTYLRACEPVEVDVTLLSVADRLATRGDRAQESTEAHLRVARQLLPEALRWRAQGPPRPLLRGDELAGELGIATGPQLGVLLEGIAEAQYAGELRTRDQALRYARKLLQTI
jgi:poly(A) polymerase